MENLKTFYKSRKWEKLVRQIRLERDNICEHCGTPIIKKYDCIAHHRQELTEANVNDYDISLNKDNIALVHFKCHNEIHNRFGDRKMKVYIVFGSPRAGKTTFVKHTAGSKDIILDIDNLWQAISNNARYVKPKGLTRNIYGIRDCIIDQVKIRLGQWNNAYIITTSCNPIELKGLKDRLNAELIHIEEEKEICLQRAELIYDADEDVEIHQRTAKIAEYKQLINNYFNDYKIYKNQIKEL